MLSDWWVHGQAGRRAGGRAGGWVPWWWLISSWACVQLHPSPPGQPGGSLNALPFSLPPGAAEEEPEGGGAGEMSLVTQ